MAASHSKNTYLSIFFCLLYIGQSSCSHFLPACVMGPQKLWMGPHLRKKPLITNVVSSVVQTCSWNDEISQTYLSEANTMEGIMSLISPIRDLKLILLEPLNWFSVNLEFFNSHNLSNWLTCSALFASF